MCHKRLPCMARPRTDVCDACDAVLSTFLLLQACTAATYRYPHAGVTPYASFAWCSSWDWLHCDDVSMLEVVHLTGSRLCCLLLLLDASAVRVWHGEPLLMKGARRPPRDFHLQKPSSNMRVEVKSGRSTSMIVFLFLGAPVALQHEDRVADTCGDGAALLTQSAEAPRHCSRVLSEGSDERGP
jgi:hypothetical protein